MTDALTTGVLFAPIAQTNLKHEASSSYQQKAIDTLKTAGGDFEVERATITRALQEKNDRVLELEVELVNERERTVDLQEKLKDGDRPLKRKVLMTRP